MLKARPQYWLVDLANSIYMANVDLTPTSVNIANTPKSSNHTSVKLHCEQATQSQQPNTLMPFAGNPKENIPKGLHRRKPTKHTQLVKHIG